MNRTPIRSSNLVAIAYDAEKMILEIEFRGKRIYQYESVPLRIWHGLTTATSAGSYFDANIRDVFPYKSITEQPQE